MADEYTTVIGAPAAAVLDLASPPVMADAELQRLPSAGSAFTVDVGNVYFVNKRDWQSSVAHTCLRSVIDGE